MWPSVVSMEKLWPPPSFKLPIPFLNYLKHIFEMKLSGYLSSDNRYNLILLNVAYWSCSGQTDAGCDCVQGGKISLCLTEEAKGVVSQLAFYAIQKQTVKMCLLFVTQLNFNRPSATPPERGTSVLM